MLRIGGVTISDDLRIGVGNQTVQLRPSQGYRLVETLLRATARQTIREEVAGPAARVSKKSRPAHKPQVRC